MINDPINDHSITQSTMALLAKVNLSTIHRKVNVEGVDYFEHPKSKKKYYSVSTAGKIISSLLPFKRSVLSKRVQVFFNFKGGTGKTSICFQTAGLLAYLGYKVLAIDCDAQGHLSRSFGFPESFDQLTMYNVLIEGLPISEAIYPVEGFDNQLHLIPGNLSLTRVERPLSDKTRREYVLLNILNSIKDHYDFILIDTNPTISSFNVNCLVASDHINIVCETHPYSVAGLGQLLNSLEETFNVLQIPLSFSVIPNKYESKTVTAQQVLGLLRRDYAKETVPTIVRKSEDINISTKNNLPICCFSSKKSPALEDLIDLVYDILALSYEDKK